MAGQFRDLLPWEARCGCPTCKVRPGQRCITTRPLHMKPSPDELARVGTPTTAHRARYRLWCWLWGGNACTNTIPSNFHHLHGGQG